MPIKLRYVGGSRPGQTVALPSGLDLTILYGETGTFPTEMAHSLLDQDIWIRANAPWGEDEGNEDPDEDAELEAAREEVARRNAVAAQDEAAARSAEDNPEVEHPGHDEEETN